QAPTLSYWWLHSHFDFDDAQARQVRSDIDGFFDWHRREELPAYAELLRQWQALALGDVSADQACQHVAQVRQRLIDSGARTVAPFARLATQFTAAQLEHLQRRQARSNERFARDFLRGSPEQRLEHRLAAVVERSERFYGPLGDAQRALLRGWL